MRSAARCNGSATGLREPIESDSAVWAVAEEAGLRVRKGPGPLQKLGPEDCPLTAHQLLEAAAPEENWSSVAHHPEGA